MFCWHVFGNISGGFRGISRFFGNFAGFRGNTWISRVHDRAKYQKPCIQDKLKWESSGFDKSLLTAFLQVFSCLWILVIIQPGSLFAYCGCKIEEASDSFLLLPFIFPVPIQIHFFRVFLFSQLSSVFRNTEKWRATFFKKYKQKCNHIFWTPGTGCYTVHASLECWAKLLLLGHALEDVFNLYKLSVKVNLRSDGIDHWQ